MDPNLEKLHTGKSLQNNKYIKKSPEFLQRNESCQSIIFFNLICLKCFLFSEKAGFILEPDPDFSIDIQLGLWMDTDTNVHEINATCGKFII